MQRSKHKTNHQLKPPHSTHIHSQTNEITYYLHVSYYQRERKQQSNWSQEIKLRFNPNNLYRILRLF